MLPGVVSKPKPSIVRKLALAATKLDVVPVTTGVTVATWTAEPLDKLLVVTIAVRVPAVVGLVVNVTIKEVADAVVTVPTASPFNTTVLLPTVVSKPKPLIVSVVASADKLEVALVT